MGREEEDEASQATPQLEYERLSLSSSEAALNPAETASPFVEPSSSASPSAPKNTDAKLVLVFCLLVVFGSGNVVFTKLQAVPLYNYPNFINLFGTFLYIPLTWAYIIPVSRYGWLGNAITPQQLALPKRPFAIMGCLDCLACMMQVFSSVYLPGPLLILLPQAAIPFSMILSKHLLGHKYHLLQYVGAIIVLAGIVVVLEPMISHRHAPDFICDALDEDRDCSICQVEMSEQGCLSHRLDVDPAFMSFVSQRDRFWSGNETLPDTDDNEEGEPICEWIEASSGEHGDEWFTLIWSFVMILSCLPMTLSSIYKEIALGDDVELDPVYLNGWIAIFQFFFSLALAVPAGLASSPQINPADIPSNIYNGFRCYLGSGTIDTGCHPDAMCASHAALFFNVGLLFNIGYTILMMFILKFGSANVLFLALTVMVPIGNLAFALPFMPQTTNFHLSDLLGLGVIMLGLALYRFADQKADESAPVDETPKHPPTMHFQLREPLLTGDV